ncbi:hypothetical protein AUC61_19920 [Pseudomonas sp. S25]|uniref:Pilus assembly protein CpaD n=1 Tax=Pseudomonas maioricensis TaxID=1766623 RepID=A0ABS9ZML3_9PSED|nr:CpaD family pilus assembly lipoprotein [Pseudomonas sp. S25]MCI8211805.1 hypothetical protein [Pseudomonas sp. S25]
MPVVKSLLSLVVVALLLGGCDRPLNQMRESRFAPHDQAQAQGITVAPSAMVTSLQATPNGGFTPESLANLNTLLKAQGRLRNQTLTLQPLTPVGEKLAERLASVLREQGANLQQLRVAPVQLQAGNTQDWDLQVISEALVVKTPECAIADDKTWTVKPYMAVGTLGCANRANVARMVADPRDLVRAQTLDAGDGTAAVNAVSRYQDGETRELLDIDFNED